MPYALINARPSPFGRKVAIAMLEKAIPFEARHDVPWGDATCTPQYNPLEQLPILIGENGQTVYDSSFILEWLEKKHPQPALMPAGVDDFLHERFLQMLGERLMEIAQDLLMELNRETPSKPWVERQERKIRGGLAELEKQIGGRRVDDASPISLGDIAVGTTLLLWEFMVEAGYSVDHPDFRWRGKYPNLTEYAALLERRPSFEQTRPQPMDVDIKATVR